MKLIVLRYIEDVIIIVRALAMKSVITFLIYTITTGLQIIKVNFFFTVGIFLINILDCDNT